MCVKITPTDFCILVLIPDHFDIAAESHVSAQVLEHFTLLLLKVDIVISLTKVEIVSRSISGALVWGWTHHCL